MTHQLQNKWTLWEQASQQSQKTYGSDDREVCEFGTVEEFWKSWSYIPKPSEVFYDGHTKKVLEGERTIGGFCLFKKGIKPEWEDPANATGSELVCRSLKSLNVVDVFWENLVLGLIGETIDEGDEICGARIVNKTTGKLNLKLEIWFRNRSSDVAGRIKERLLDALMEGGEANKLGQRGIPDFVYKIHG